MRKSIYWCNFKHCKHHLSEEKELQKIEENRSIGYNKTVLTGCHQNWHGVKHCDSYEPSDESILNSMLGLKKELDTWGPEAFKLLLEKKAVLKIWRRTTPYNYWVEKKGGKPGDYIYHSSEWGRPNMNCFIDIEDSPNLIGYSWLHSDGGKSEESTYRLNNDYIKIYKNSLKKKK